MTFCGFPEEVSTFLDATKHEIFIFTCLFLLVTLNLYL